MHNSADAATRNPPTLHDLSLPSGAQQHRLGVVLEVAMFTGLWPARERCGHRTDVEAAAALVITSDVYTHLIGDRARHAAEAVAALVPRAGAHEVHNNSADLAPVDAG